MSHKDTDWRLAGVSFEQRSRSDARDSEKRMVEAVGVERLRLVENT
jgi:hypothetical protein